MRHRLLALPAALPSLPPALTVAPSAHAADPTTATTRCQAAPAAGAGR
ncbi:hypothetical protein [Streptomyces phaeoluteigriseus]|nr:hypothetical protein [Streptomyces phaeoluteigriseus]